MTTRHVSALPPLREDWSGYASDLDSKRTRLPLCLIGLIIAVVILLILDLDRPNSGFITNGHQAMLDAAASIASFPD
jgi:hypothetical protein